MKNEINIKGKAIGRYTKICTSLIGKSIEELREEAMAVLLAMPDIIEWRADYLEANSISDYENALHEINKLLPNYPLIFTLRSSTEGGFRHINGEDRMAIIKAMLNLNCVDIVDVELSNPDEFVEEIMQYCKSRGIYTIISNHDFDNTPSTDEILSVLHNEVAQGADIAKVAFMPKSFTHVLNLLNAIDIFNNQNSTPLIAISMGKIGVLTRISADILNLAITFASLKNSSAPGQIPVAKLREFISFISEDKG